MTAARLGCAVLMKGGKTFVQIHTDEPLLDCRVLASAIGVDEADATAKAMQKAGVDSLVTGPRPRSQRPGDEARERSLLAGLVACEIAVDSLLGVIRGY